MSKRILVVEDDPNTRRMLADRLERSGYSVESASDGQEGLDALQKGAFDGMILDIYMPRLNGFDILRHLRESRSLIPVMMITGHPECADQAIAGGAKVCLIKPFSLDELKQAVKRWIGPP